MGAKAGCLHRAEPPQTRRLYTRCSADLADVGRVRALGAGGHLEFDLVVLLEVLEAAAVDRAEVHEDVRSVLLADEAEALVSVEPFDGAGAHVRSLLSCRTRTSCIRRPRLRAGKGTARSRT